jgi:GNAT superfamily N-acetyltransferase
VTRLDAPRVDPSTPAGVDAGAIAFRHTTPLDPQARVVLRDLEREYDARYGNLFGEPASVEIARYAPDAFAAPGGTFLVAELDGEVVSAGAFMTIDERTVEFKRMWTRADHRGRGLARLVLRELEREARARGYARVVLSTGPRQPEAVRLYLATGYTPLFDRSLDPAQIVIHHFEKELS